MNYRFIYRIEQTSGGTSELWTDNLKGSITAVKHTSKQTLSKFSMSQEMQAIKHATKSQLSIYKENMAQVETQDRVTQANKTHPDLFFFNEYCHSFMHGSSPYL
jgi:hypothetical protein